MKFLPIYSSLLYQIFYVYDVKKINAPSLFTLLFQLETYIFGFVLQHSIYKIYTLQYSIKLFNFTLLILMMNLKEYNKFVDIINSLTISKTPGLLFQNYVEEQINNIEFSKFFNSNKDEPNKYIRLKNPQCRNNKDRGLKICLKNKSLLKEEIVKVNSILFKFEPLVRVVGLNSENCSQCCRSIETFGKFQDNNKIVICNNCNVRKFCSQDCKLQALLEWHDLECDFINFIEKELVIKKENNVNNKFEHYFEKVILILITTFRLLVKLIRCNPKILDIVINMSDHLNLYEQYNKTGSCESKEQEEIFEDTKRTFGPLLVLYFQTKKKENQKNQSTIKDINKDGICRSIFLVLINVSSLMEGSNNCNNIGLLFDPIFSMINHSCDPNSTLIWKDSGEVLVKNIKELKSMDEIFINYIPIQMPKEIRQIQLKNCFFFNCRCSKCLINDNKFDSMLPINCINCKQNNFGFKLENFENLEFICKNEIQICCNCENIIDSKKIFNQYLEIFSFFKLINNIKTLKDLSNWSLDSENIFKMNKFTFNKCILILKKSYGVLPINSWPMVMLLNIVKIQIQIKEPFNLNVLRLTFLINLFGEFFKINNGLIEINIGIIFYDLCIISADYLFDQYTKFKNSINKEIIDIIGKGTFAMCILSFKYLQKRFQDINEKDREKIKDYKLKFEQSEQDMIHLSNEIKRLIEHYLNETTNQEKMVYFQEYNQYVFEKSLNYYERYLDCSDYVQLKELILELDEHDYDVFQIGKAAAHSNHAAVNGDELSSSNYYSWLMRNKNCPILPAWMAQL